MAIYTNKVVWKGEHLGHTYCENGTDMEFSAPPALQGHPQMMTPEDALNNGGQYLRAHDGHLGIGTL